jgi:hypothetical protein
VRNALPLPSVSRFRFLSRFRSSLPEGRFALSPPFALSPFLVGVFLFAVLQASPAAAQTSYPMLTHVFPAGVQRGTTTEVTVHGRQNFAGVYKVLFEGEGLSAEVVPPKPEDKKPPDKKPDETKKGKTKPSVDSVTLKVTAAPDAPVGVRELRVATPRGVSSTGLIIVGDEPEVQEVEPNDSPEKAQRVMLPVTINGRIQAAEDVDQYRFTAHAGEEVTFSVLAARLEDKIHDLQEHVDPLLVLRDGAGREIARADDTYGADPLLIHRFERDGDYLIEIRDVRYHGNPDWVYRLTLTRRPWITALLPMAARPGETTTLQLVGANLGTMPSVSWTAPSDAPAGLREVQLQAGAAVSNPVPFIVSDLQERLEPGSAEPSARRITIPCGVSGRISADNEVDRYPFHAAKGQEFVFEIEARRYGSALDSFLSVVDAGGKELESNDDAIGKDSRLEWTAPADGEYAVLVRDLNNRGGPEFVYHLIARPVRPDFSLKCDGDKAQIGPGGGTAWYVHLTRTGGFSGEVALSVRGLLDGVTATCGAIPAGMTEGCILLTAGPQARIDAKNVQVVGTAALKAPDGSSTSVSHVATPLEEIYTPGGGRGLFPVAMQTVSVTEPQDITLTASPERVTLSPGGTAKIDITIQRRADFTKGVTLDLLLRHLGSVYGNPLPPGVTLDEPASKTLLGETETKGALVLRAASDAAPVKDLPIGVLGQVSINFVVKVSYAAPVFLSVTPRLPSGGK